MAALAKSRVERPPRKKTGSLFVELPPEGPDAMALDDLLRPDADAAEVFGDAYDDGSDAEDPGDVAARATRDHVTVLDRPRFRELVLPESAKLAAALGAGEAPEPPEVEESRTVDGEAKTVVRYAAWLETQAYGDDLKFVNADFVEFELNATKILIGQERGLGKGGHFWDGAYVLAEALIVAPPRALVRGGAPTVLELGAGAGLTGIALALGYETSRVTLTDGDSGVLGLLRQNCHRNRCAAEVKRLAWKLDPGQATDAQSENSWKPKGDDEEEEAKPETYDVIVAAEAVAPIYDARALVATLRRHAHARTEVRLVCKDGRWPDHARHFYECLGEHFDFRVSEPITKLKATYFSVVSARLKRGKGAGKVVVEDAAEEGKP